MGAGGLRQDAKATAIRAKTDFADRNLGEAVKSAVSAAMRTGKAVIAEIASKRGEATEFRLHSDHFEIVSMMRNTPVNYSDVESIKKAPGTKHRYHVKTGLSEIKIAPVAWIESGPTRVPIGWERNGFEVPFTLLIEELAARCGIEVEA
jgi:hypothetical protein